jgi:protease secretion system membrane fusion protein
MTPATASPQDAPDVNAPIVPNADYGSVVRMGYWILFCGFGGFLAWAVFAPLDEAVPAPGVVAVESKRKRVDHLTGGIVRKISVREGQSVVEGQELIVLDEAQAKSALNTTLSQWYIAAATEARLIAERQGLRDIVFPDALTKASSNPEIAAAMKAQTELFRSRKAALEGDLAIIRESVRGLEVQVRSLDQLRSGREKQVELFQEQIASFQKLKRDGFISRNQLLETERQFADVLSKQSDDLSNIASINARLAEFKMRESQRRFEYRREVETQLAEVQKDIAPLSERLAGLRDTYTRLVLKAPVSGTVVDLAFHTIGGIVKPGDRILDIVPSEDTLIVEAQLPPQYIDRVRVGLPADVHFDAFMGRMDSPVVAGNVVTVSADALTEPRTGSQFYTIRAAIPATEIKKLGNVQIQPGMQGTVMIKTGERSLLVYLVRPILRRFIPALSER